MVFVQNMVNHDREDISLLYNTNDDNRIYHTWNIHGTSHIEVISICKIDKGGKLK